MYSAKLVGQYKLRPHNNIFTAGFVFRSRIDVDNDRCGKHNPFRLNDYTQHNVWRVI